MKNIIYLLLGVLFGITMYKSETASWFRIYEMFMFQSFHMYGFMGSALVVSLIGVQLIKKKKFKNIDGEQIVFENKIYSITRYLVGGILFGLGWALVGACPGPLFVLLGSGVYSVLIVILGALLGTYLYGITKKYIPH